LIKVAAFAASSSFLKPNIAAYLRPITWAIRKLTLMPASPIRFGERIAQSLPIVATTSSTGTGDGANAAPFSSGFQCSFRNRVNFDRPFVSVGKTTDHYEPQVGTAVRERLERLGHCTRVVIKLLFPKEGLLSVIAILRLYPTFLFATIRCRLLCNAELDWYGDRRIPGGAAHFRRGPESDFCG
jgi:hypothetical protein